MKTIVYFLCALLLIVCAHAAPSTRPFLASSRPTHLSTDFNIKPINICPIPKCMQIKEPCDNIQISFMMVNGKKCPMCPYCASSTKSSTTSPEY